MRIELMTTLHVEQEYKITWNDYIQQVAIIQE